MKHEPNGDLLTIQNLRTTFHIRGTEVEAVRGVSLRVGRSEIVGIVGESGSGKSVTMKSVMGILPENAAVQADRLEFDGADLLTLPESGRRRLRGAGMSMIFQDPMTALNPLKKIGTHIEEVLIRHRGMNRSQAAAEAVRVLGKVGIPSPEKRLRQYPHEFSGGMRQRVLIAMALACQPKLLIADEPTTALDVTIQAQILELLHDLQRDEGMSILLITHDLGVVASFCDRIAVMYGGLIMEKGTTDQIFYEPRHPYTRALLQAVPKPTALKQRLAPIPGSAPSLVHPPAGCPFAARCPQVMPECRLRIPPLRHFADGQESLCVLPGPGEDTHAKEEAPA